MTIKPLIDQLAGYNRWANTRFVERLQAEPEAVLDRPLASSFPTLRDTLLHIRDAENAWMHRLEGIAPVPWPAETDRAIATLLTYSIRLEDLLRQADEDWLLSTVAYHDLRGNRHEQVRWQMVLHCINHGTQHRGQVITMMRGLVLASIPPNDLVVYQRSTP
jgi:uncharacterized damage-inducible protein DinB